MPTPLISVLLPVYNAAETVARAIQSVQQQSLRDWELIVVDDGSSDDTPGLLQAVARQYPTIRLALRPHRGIVAALNDGLSLARAPFIARMDADDESKSHRLARQLSFLTENPKIGLVGSLVEFGGDTERAGGFALHVAWMNSVIGGDQIALNRFVESPFAHPSVMFRRELIDQFGAYGDGDFPEDYELWLRWLDAGVGMGKVPEVLFKWQDSSNRLSRCDPRYAAENFYRCKAHYLAKWLKRQVAPERELLVWGAGRPTRKRAAHLESHGICLSGYIDIDPAKIGRKLAGRAVLSPNDLPRPEACFVLCYVAKRGARDLARAHLATRGFVEGWDFIAAA